MKPLNIVLVEPEIPQNTGNVARTCACTGSVLHLVEPMGFRLTQRNLQRAGCDYWDDVEIVQWPCADAFFEAHGEDELHLFTGHVSRNFTDVAYGEGAFLLFGRESRGLDEAFIQRYLDACVRIPMREYAQTPKARVALCSMQPKQESHIHTTNMSTLVTITVLATFVRE